MSKEKKIEEVTWITSENYNEAGPFDINELTLRAQKRLFSWNMYVYKFPKDDMWRPARDVPEIKEILLKHFPLRQEDTGPAGGHIIENSSHQLIEVSPFDAGFCQWEDAKKLCENFLLNGCNGWRLPEPNELRYCSGLVSRQLRNKKNITETDELIIHWSGQREGDKAVAVVTCEVQDYYVFPVMLSYMTGPSGGYWKSKNGPWCGNEIKCPVTECHQVRPVRDLVIQTQSSANSKTE